PDIRHSRRGRSLSPPPPRQRSRGLRLPIPGSREEAESAQLWPAELNSRAQFRGADWRGTEAAERRHILASGASHWKNPRFGQAPEGRHRRQSQAKGGNPSSWVCRLSGAALPRRHSRDLRPWLKDAAAPRLSRKTTHVYLALT